MEVRKEKYKQPCKLEHDTVIEIMVKYTKVNTACDNTGNAQGKI